MSSKYLANNYSSEKYSKYPYSRQQSAFARIKEIEDQNDFNQKITNKLERQLTREYHKRRIDNFFFETPHLSNS